MIHVSVLLQDGDITSLKISGHANAGAYGSDVVCAAVSAAAFGLGNALDELKADAETVVTRNRIEIRAGRDERTQIIMRTGLIQLETIREKQKRFIEIRKTEV